MGNFFKRIADTRITRHLTQHGPVLGDHQYGFRKGISTMCAIDRLIGMSKRKVQRGDAVLAIYINIVYVFNTVSWEKVIDALAHHGVDAH